jgi:uncharacterized protein YecE (DUF72 family)
MNNLRIGTCSWKYPSWHKLVYSKSLGINYLEEYARKYSTVEIDQWFWSLFPNGKIKLPEWGEVEEYANSITADFKFTVKIPNSITLTHYYSKDKEKPAIRNTLFLSREVLKQFIALLGPIHNNLGPLIFQFEYLNKQKMESQEHFQQQLKDFIFGLQRSKEFAMEVRNPNYLNEGYFDFLLTNNILPVFLQGYWMPNLWEIIERYQSQISNFKTIIIRLHGQDREGIEKESEKSWNKIIHPRDEELKMIAEKISYLVNQGKIVYVNVNNHFEGSAPLTIEKLKSFLAI